MAGNKDIPRVQNPPQGDGHHVTYRYMTATELAERDARQNAYDAMLARQEAFERSREIAAQKPDPVRAGCVFAKSCKLPDAIIDYANPSGMVPTDSLKDYGELIVLGAREADASGAVALKKISSTAIPTGIGHFALAGSAFEALPAVAASTAAATLVGLVALFMPSALATALSTPTNNCARSNRPAPAYACESNKRPQVTPCIPLISASSIFKRASRRVKHNPKGALQPSDDRVLKMIFLALSGFFPESNPDDSLQYDKDVPQTSEQAVLNVMGWKSLKDVPMGEHDLTQTQAREIMQLVNTPFRDDLIYCIGLCRED